MEYEAIIGLETHVQLKTASKLWCGCPNRFGDPPNTNVCPICLGLPGTLPVPNAEAIRLAILAGLLLHCRIVHTARFDRKNYFYPDMPKNYQISQYEQPFAVDGYVEFEYEGRVRRIRILRAHLEEDVGKSVHLEDKTGLDFNRAGVPLLEIVSAPEIESPDMAYAYLSYLREILAQAGVSDCDMEKGMLRCDVNVSVRPRGEKEFGVKVEIKNLNSISAVRRALTYEIARQIKILEAGGTLVQSTRRWNEQLGVTEEMRTKEYAHDYRYFPEPDLVPFEISPEWIDQIRHQLIELPLDRKHRLVSQYGLPVADAQVLAWNRELGDYFEILVHKGGKAKTLANWLINTLQGLLSELNEQAKKRYINEHGTDAGWQPMRIDNLPFSPDSLLRLIELVEQGEISVSAGQTVLQEMIATGKDPESIVKERGLRQISDTAQLESLCDQVIAEYPGPVQEVRNGKIGALNFLVGQVMRLSRGTANPRLVQQVLRERLRIPAD